MSSDQYLLDFSSRANERCARIAGLRSALLPVEMSAGRLDGVVELLQRLVLFAPYLSESMRDVVTVDAQVNYIGTRIERRPSASERTVRNWTRDAKLLRLLVVQYNSHHRGGRKWNSYTIHFSWLLELTAPERQRPATAGNGRQPLPPYGAATIAAPRAATIAAPLNVLTKEITNDSPAQSSESTKPAYSPDWTDQRKAVVVSDLEKLGMSTDGACGAVAAAIARELTHAQACELVERYRTAHLADTHMTVGWLHRWLTGRSRPSEIASGYAHAQTRGDALTRQQVASETLRASIVRRGRAAGANEEAIAQRCREAGVEY